MAKKLFFVALLLALAIVSVDLFVNVSADPHDLVQGMMEGSAHLAKGAVDTALAGGEMAEGVFDKTVHPLGHGLFGHHSEGSDSESGSGSGSASASGSASGSVSGSGSGSGSGSASGGSGMGGSGMGPGLLRR